MPPKVWFHGSQSHNTGGSSARNAITVRICSWFAVSMRCVLITPFGAPVDPDVNRIFATVSGPTVACASSTRDDGSVPASSENEVAFSESGGVHVTISAPDADGRLARARSNAGPSAAKTSPARITDQMDPSVR